MQSAMNSSYGPVPPVTDTVAALEEAIWYHVRYSLGKAWQSLSKRDLFVAVALAVRDRMVDKMFETAARYHKADVKRLYYVSMEFLIGRLLGTNLQNLGLLDLCQEALMRMGVDLEELREEESDPALGNGGLGRLAACFLDSLATLGMPGYGYGINYEYGLFKQQIEAGYQKEQPDCWGPFGSPFLLKHPYDACRIPLYGRVERSYMRNGVPTWRWVDWQMVLGVPYDL